MNSKKYDIKGMTCTACALTIERQLSKLEGVESVAVNYATEQMLVNYDEASINDTFIEEAVVKVGYEAIDLSSDQSPASSHHSKNASTSDHATVMYRRLMLSLIFTIPVFYIAMGPMIGLPLPSILSGQKNLLFMALTQLLLTIPVMFIGAEFYKVGFRTLLKGAPNMDSLIAVGTSAAFIYGIFVIYRLSYGFAYNDMDVVHRYGHDLYFESVAVIITLITVGKYLEARAKSKTSAAIEELLALTPDEAIILVDGEEKIVAVDAIKLGAIILIKPGSKIPVDGNVIEGSSTMDESMLTGESMPVEKTINDTVIAGTINQTGSLKFIATKIGNDTTLSKIIQMVEDAQGTKAPIAKLADTISAYFVPTVLGISLISFIVWTILGMEFEFAFRIAVSILVISCPCALGLATPTAIMVGTGRGAKHGTLIKSGEALELMHKVSTVVFDKTGTLTNGEVIVTDVISFDDKATMLSYTATVEHSSEHPLSKAIMTYVKGMSIDYGDAIDFEAMVGYGVEGSIEHPESGPINVIIGNEKLMDKHGIYYNNKLSDIHRFANEGKTPIFVAYNKRLQGIIALSDTIKLDAIEAVRTLQSMKIKVVMLTGDHELTANAIGKEVGVDQIYADVLPSEKADIIKSLQKDGTIVMMVGDGINDAVALVSADIGLAIGSGTDVAIESADVVLIKNQIMDVVTAIQLSKATITNIKQNLFWAFFYNIVGIPIAAGVLYKSSGILLNPMIAAAAMSFSSVSVVTNALRLRNFKPKYITTKKTKEIKMKKLLTVEGMTCGHCSGRVEKTLNEMNGVTCISVELDTKLATIELTSDITDDLLKSAIKEQGYEVTKIVVA